MSCQAVDCTVCFETERFGEGGGMELNFGVWIWRKSRQTFIIKDSFAPFTACVCLPAHTRTFRCYLLPFGSVHFAALLPSTDVTCLLARVRTGRQEQATVATTACGQRPFGVTKTPKMTSSRASQKALGSSIPDHLDTSHITGRQADRLQDWEVLEIGGCPSKRSKYCHSDVPLFWSLWSGSLRSTPGPRQV